MSEVDIHGIPLRSGDTLEVTTTYTTTDDRYPQVDPKMADQLSPYQVEALQALRQHRGRAVAQGNTLHTGKTLYIATTTARALERRGLVDIRKEQAAFAMEEVVTMSDRGHEWLDMATGRRKKKRVSKAQKQKAIDDLVDVLRTGRP